MFNSSATFSVPGAGKTTEALALFCLNSNPDSKLLVLCPKNAFIAWDENLKECFNTSEMFNRLTLQPDECKRIFETNIFKCQNARQNKKSNNEKNNCQKVIINFFIFDFLFG